ncbi:MAG: molybdopterin-binding protein [Pseudomonadota bacterium]
MPNEEVRPQPATDADTITAAVLVIGDEILSGRTKDRNIGHIAEIFTGIGIDLREARVIGDDRTEIVTTLNALRERYTYVVTTGGIGPTHDDITAESVAAAFDVGIDVDERALGLMQPYYESRGLELTPSRLRMARIPHGATLIKNQISIAPGFMLGNVIVLAGVPDIMQVMLDDAIQHLKVGKKMLSRSVRTKVPEGEMADLFADHQSAWPDIAMGSYPAITPDGIRCELVLRSIDAEKLGAAHDALVERLKDHGIPIEEATI